MILEVATLNIYSGQSDAYEAAFEKAQAIISSMPGYLGHQLQKCVEVEDKYILFVQWQTIEDHIEGFRNSPQFQEWRKQTGPFYDGPPQVEHYELRFGGG